MQGIYFTTMCNIEDPNDTRDLGIKEKIRQQVEMMRSNGLDIYFNYAQINVRFYRFLNRMPFFKDYFHIEPKIVSNAGFIYIRKPSTINMGFIDFLKEIRQINSSIKIILEIPTYPYDSEIQGIVRIPLKIKDKIARKKLKHYVDVILTYSDDKMIFGIPTINLSNGIDTRKCSAAIMEFDKPQDDVVRMIACANFNLWHGYDRVIEGVQQYLQKENANKKFEIEMVGDGSLVPQYRELVEKYQLQDYIKFHGKLHGKALAKVYAQCDIGLDSMGRHRSGVFYNSSLKGKEYCAYGLTIVSGVETELDRDDQFEYYYRIPADDSPVDIEGILDFYSKIIEKRKNKTAVRSEIMEYAQSHFDIGVVFTPVIDYIKS